MKSKPWTLKLGKAPLVVASVVSVRDLDRAARTRSPSWDMVEIRLDLIKPRDERWLSRCDRLMDQGIPVLLTVRSAREGGAWKKSETERIGEYKRYMSHMAAVDVELRSSAYLPVARAAHEQGRMVIASFHDFQGTPREKRLLALIEKARKRGADIVKLATFVRNPMDVAVLFRLLEARKKGPLCLIGMGPLGRFTRLGLSCLGSCLAYGHIGTRAAPGQWHCRDMKRWLARLE